MNVMYCLHNAISKIIIYSFPSAYYCPALSILILLSRLIKFHLYYYFSTFICILVVEYSRLEVTLVIIEAIRGSEAQIGTRLVNATGCGFEEVNTSGIWGKVRNGVS